MSVPWVERYRPKKLDEVVGQQKAAAQLKQYVANYHAGNPNMPHLMFTGPPGVGKTTIAHALARELFGENWKSVTLDSNASVDRGIGVVRGRIKDFAKTTPMGEHFNVIILDEADALTSEAQDALRRVMEDYHKTCRFVLACNYPRRIIQPIMDRCAVYNFEPLDNTQIYQTLENICTQENVKSDPAALVEIAVQSKGSLRRAIGKLQQVASLNAGVTLELVQKNDDTHAYGDVFALLAKDEVKEAEKSLLTIIRKGTSSDDLFMGLFETIDASKLPSGVKNKILMRLGEYEFRVNEGCNLELQARCFIRELAAMKG